MKKTISFQFLYQ